MLSSPRPAPSQWRRGGSGKSPPPSLPSPSPDEKPRRLRYKSTHSPLRAQNNARASTATQTHTQRDFIFPVRNLRSRLDYNYDSGRDPRTRQRNGKHRQVNIQHKDAPQFKLILSMCVFLSECARSVLILCVFFFLCQGCKVQAQLWRSCWLLLRSRTT